MTLIWETLNHSSRQWLSEFFQICVGYVTMEDLTHIQGEGPFLYPLPIELTVIITLW